jgi:uncharacterized membrane protein HdeD (DUF308 family)
MADSSSPSAKQSWGAHLFVGILLMITGIFALGSIAFTSVFTILLLGWVLIIGGAAQFFSIFFIKKDRLGMALLGILYFVFGLMIISNPGVSLAVVTLFMAIMWTVGGLVRAVAALLDNSEHKALNLIGGIITFILGVMVWSGWPESSMYILGLFVGIDLLIAGIAWTGFSIKLRKSGA